MLAEQLVGEARARRPREMFHRERVVVGASAVLFLAAALAAATLLPSERHFDPLFVAGLVAGYAVVSRVRFEFGNWYVVPEQLVLVPLLLLAPLPYVPLLVAGAAVVSMVPDYIEGSWHKERAISCLSDSWFAVGPTFLLAALAPGDPTLRHVEVYVVAFACQLGSDFLWTLVRDRLVDRISFRTIIHNYLGVARFDAILAPVGFVITLAAVDEPLMLLAIGPLVWLLTSSRRIGASDTPQRSSFSVRIAARSCSSRMWSSQRIATPPTTPDRWWSSHMRWPTSWG